MNNVEIMALADKLEADRKAEEDYQSDELEIIPRSELSNYKQSVLDLELQSKELDALGVQALQFTTIRTKDEANAAAAILSQIRSRKKIPGFKIDPFLDIIKRVANHVREIRDNLDAKIKGLDEPLAQKIADFDRREKAAAQKEEDEKNAVRRKEAADKAAADKREADWKAEEERQARQREINAAAKAGDVGKREAAQLKKQADEDADKIMQQNAQKAVVAATDVKDVKVKADIPRGIGLRRVTRWFWRVTDITKIPREKLYPSKQQDGTYDTAKFPAITELVNSEKNKAKAEAACPGIEVWSKETV
jgi:hypothetical protein